MDFSDIIPQKNLQDFYTIKNEEKILGEGAYS
jgi:hypothetical protein